MNDTTNDLDVRLQRADALLAENNARNDDPLVGRVWARLAKERNLHLHIRTGWLFGEHFVQLCDWNVRDQGYERIFFVRSDLLPELIGLLQEVARYAIARLRIPPARRPSLPPHAIPYKP